MTTTARDQATPPHPEPRRGQISWAEVEVPDPRTWRDRLRRPWQVAKEVGAALGLLDLLARLIGMFFRRWSAIPSRSLIVALLALLFACSADESVDWENYSPAVRQRIDRMAAKRDCAGLQKEFNVAEQNNAAQRQRTGDGNADLMGYIDRKMEAADCY